MTWLTFVAVAVVVTLAGVVLGLALGRRLHRWTEPRETRDETAGEGAEGANPGDGAGEASGGADDGSASPGADDRIDVDGANEDRGDTSD